jgi:hypothetical protein
MSDARGSASKGHLLSETAVRLCADHFVYDPDYEWQVFTCSEPDGHSGPHRAAVFDIDRKRKAEVTWATR